jgi:hypothetical protein
LELNFETAPAPKQTSNNLLELNFEDLPPIPPLAKKPIVPVQPPIKQAPPPSNNINFNDLNLGLMPKTSVQAKPKSIKPPILPSQKKKPVATAVKDEDYI